MILRGTKEASKVLRWVSQAISKDKTRPVLRGIRFENGTVVGTDGYRMHVAPRPTLGIDEGFPFDEDAASYEGKIRAGAFVEELTPIDGTYPDWKGIDPFEQSQVPEFTIGVNGKYLSQAVKDLGNVKLTFYGPSSPIRIDAMDEEDERYVVLMPVHLDR